ncbi:MAG: 16S rRNA (adenine(1518)-N(6)/adenine(1519)-N(6))-dimethyltransferase RsmA [Pseudomonadota bacterium]
MTAPRTLLKAWDLRPRKELGQNFLENPATAEKIAAAAGITKEDVVLEIGAGLGSLTVPIAQRAGRVVAVETDPRLVDLLRTEMLTRQLDHVEIVKADILSLDLSRWAQPGGRKIVVVGNLPYNISSQIIIRLIAARAAIRCAVVMLQKELADRLAAPPGTKTYGRITVMLAYCAAIRHVMTVGAGQFHPRPKIDSAVIDIRFTDPLAFPAMDETALFQVVRAAFGQRRKTLKNALGGGLPAVGADAIAAALAGAGIDPKRRAETLSVEEFVRLADQLTQALTD